MGQLEKLVEAFLKRPSDISFSDVAKLLQEFGYEERPTRGGSHRVFTKPNRPPIIVPTIKGRRVKRVYIEMICNTLNLEEWYESQFGA